MKYLVIAIVLFLNGCKTSYKNLKLDPLQLNLSLEHVQRCACRLKKDVKISPHQINWKDKKILNTQIEHCQCTIQFEMNDVEDPTEYIKPGTAFWQEGPQMPWDSKDNPRLNPVN